MKTTLLFILFVCGFQAIAQTPSQVTFGRYGGGNEGCTSGRGVCSFSIVKNDSNRPANAVFSRISNDEFSLRILTKDITAEDQMKISGKQFSQLGSSEPHYFLQDLDLKLNSETSEIIGSKSAIIPSGKYVLEVKDDYIQIFFTLKTQK